MAVEQSHSEKREAAMLILGVVLGGLFGFIGNLWAAYFVEWMKSRVPNFDWTWGLIGATVVLVFLTAYLLWWAHKRLHPSGNHDS